jgi:hypothetical protein
MVDVFYLVQNIPTIHAVEGIEYGKKTHIRLIERRFGGLSRYTIRINPSNPSNLRSILFLFFVKE